jgi:hypothetical protein
VVRAHLVPVAVAAVACGHLLSTTEPAADGGAADASSSSGGSSSGTSGVGSTSGSTDHPDSGGSSSGNTCKIPHTDGFGDSYPGCFVDGYTAEMAHSACEAYRVAKDERLVCGEVPSDVCGGGAIVATLAANVQFAGIWVWAGPLAGWARINSVAGTSPLCPEARSSDTNAQWF